MANKKRKAMIIDIDPQCGLYCQYNEFVGMIGKFTPDDIRDATEEGFVSGLYEFPKPTYTLTYDEIRTSWHTEYLKIKYL